MTPHTPGPWKAVGKVYVAGPTGASIARMIVMAGSSVQKDCFNEETAQANARLIASAPELLTALKRTLPWLSKAYAEGINEQCAMPRDLPYCIEQVRQAINQVEGKEQP